MSMLANPQWTSVVSSGMLCERIYLNAKSVAMHTILIKFCLFDSGRNGKKIVENEVVCSWALIVAKLVCNYMLRAISSAFG